MKQDVFNNIILNFKILKQVLKEIGDDLSSRIESVDERVIIEYKDTGEFEAQLRVAGDVLVFHMHTNVFKFDHKIACGIRHILKRMEIVVIVV